MIFFIITSLSTCFHCGCVFVDSFFRSNKHNTKATANIPVIIPDNSVLLIKNAIALDIIEINVEIKMVNMVLFFPFLLNRKGKKRIMAAAQAIPEIKGKQL